MDGSDSLFSLSTFTHEAVMKVLSPISSDGKCSSSASIFLAGPTLRETFHSFDDIKWRTAALKCLSEFKFDGSVYVPEPFCDRYDNQIEWEQRGLEQATVILFWIPRDLQLLPGFTTNIEFGEWYKSGKIVLGYPLEAPKMRYLHYKAAQVKAPIFHTLKETVQGAIDLSDARRLFG